MNARRLSAIEDGAEPTPVELAMAVVFAVVAVMVFVGGVGCVAMELLQRFGQ
jgi:hypothetical protein